MENNKEFSKRELEVKTVREGLDAFLADFISSDQKQLLELWRHWSMVMGEDLSASIVPLGTQGGKLLVGAENTMIMQEVLYLQAEILERANAFMGKDFFTNIKFMIAKEGILERAKNRVVQHLVKRPLLLPKRTNLEQCQFLNDNSAVAQCYEKYMELYTLTDKDIDR